MDQAKVDKIIQYILAVAAQGWGDYNSREVGPIHIIKYVYLADLAYARQNNGETYTGVNWRFHHYGPWSLEVFQRIEPAGLAIGASKRTITDTPYDDFDRWSVNDEFLQEKIYSNLPFPVYISINNYFKKFQTDTYDLLDYVYSTPPMRIAAPEEELSFMEAYKRHEEEKADKEILGQYKPEKVTVRAKKLRKKSLLDLKEKIQKKRGEKKTTALVTPTAPRYDEVFFKGQEWLDKMAGDRIENSEGEITVSDTVWKSPGRSEPNVQ
ncbi:hypothetical protein [Desulfogranum marinum]|uniref:hypothetical protein n=1 Tax=Desulfogranum marinum TaxID=453220 RepID=UPI0019660675|nr:hypothetical protein [Desulfogranum marinum]MBM9515045.1 hypothetical protein [Desulfogranum marinum]